MKLAKKQWVLAIAAISVLALLLFLAININMAYMHIPVFEKAAKACIGLSEGNSCSFMLGDKELKGMCEIDKKGILICRHHWLSSR